MSESNTNYDLKGDEGQMTIALPKLAFKPPLPKSYQAQIALIGCGGITSYHLEAYKAQGYKVVALCDLNQEAACKRRDEFYPKADVYTDYNQMLERDEIDVVDIALHPEPRVKAIEASLRAGKHVLSQKPFVLDLDEGERLVRLAEERGLKLAVNQNGRWAPYVRAIASAMDKKLIGQIQSISMHLHWDHTWIKGTDFEHIHHVVLYDFAIHWIDMVRLFYGGKTAISSFANVAPVPDQSLSSPMQANVLFSFDQGTANLYFNAHSTQDTHESITILGSEGALRATGGVCGANEIVLIKEEGIGYPKIEGSWFPDGFKGTMGELLCAIEEDREPENSGRDNLSSMAMAMAAIQSADSGQVVQVGDARQLGDSCKVVRPEE